MEFLEQSFPNVEIAVAHGKVLSPSPIIFYLTKGAGIKTKLGPNDEDFNAINEISTLGGHVNDMNIIINDIAYSICSLFLQQYSKQLEETMEKFAQGDIKILICTNIVESGLDIQNANTIIIQDVQQFGLAQLYQVFLYLSHKS